MEAGIVRVRERYTAERARRDQGDRAPARADIEIVHCRPPSGDAEHISVNLQAVPSFEAFGRYLEAADPFAVWLQASRMVWFPWVEAARAAMLPFGSALSPPKVGSDARPPGETARD
jgi:hypothetical protein